MDATDAIAAIAVSRRPGRLRRPPLSALVLWRLTPSEMAKLSIIEQLPKLRMMFQYRCRVMPWVVTCVDVQGICLPKWLREMFIQAATKSLACSTAPWSPTIQLTNFLTVRLMP